MVFQIFDSMKNGSMKWSQNDIKWESQHWKMHNWLILSPQYVKYVHNPVENKNYHIRHEWSMMSSVIYQKLVLCFKSWTNNPLSNLKAKQNKKV